MFSTIRSNEKIGLIYQLVKRDVSSRYRGSILGGSWLFISPLLMLSLYSFAFAGILKARWPGAEEMGGIGYAINLFAGLMIFNFFSEVASRSVSVVISNANLVKKVVFPLEVFAFVNVISALIQLIFSIFILIIAIYIYQGTVHLTVLLFPLLFFVFSPFLLGISWFFSSIGVYLRDLGQLISVLLNIALFFSPIFYPLSALPKYLQDLQFLNPLSFIIEENRKILIHGNSMDWIGIFYYFIGSCIFSVFGYFWFQRVRKGFSDVL